MNFFAAEVERRPRSRCPFAELPAAGGRRRTGDVVVGIRPEDFEDAALAPAGHEAGVEFEAPVDLLESMGSEIYAYFSFSGGEVSSDELAELARDSGAAETPGAGAGLAVARLNPESEISEGQQAKLWFDGAKLHLFDPADGSSLRRSKREQEAAAAATQEAIAAEAEDEEVPDDADDEVPADADAEDVATDADDEPGAADAGDEPAAADEPAADEPDEPASADPDEQQDEDDRPQ